MFGALFDQVRFLYYFALNVALAMGYIGHLILNLAKADIVYKDIEKRAKTFDDILTYIEKNTNKIIPVIGALIIIIYISVYPALPRGIGNNALWSDAKNSVGVSYEWYEALMWMKNNTPNPEHGDFRYNSIYTIPSNGSYYYPSGYMYQYGNDSYGVMSWWDYGHDIEYIANRMPCANPFQHGIIENVNRSQWDNLSKQNDRLNDVVGSGASKFFCDVNEESAYSNLAFLGARYIIIDNEMAMGKFGAIQTWIRDTDGWTSDIKINLGMSNFNAYVDSQKFYNSIMYRLYYKDCDNMSHFRLVHDGTGDYIVGYKYADIYQGYIYPYAFTTFSNYTEAYEIYNQARQPVWIIQDKVIGYDARPPEKKVKIYERVNGATIMGYTNSTSVIATLELLSDAGRPFTYNRIVATQNNTFTMIVSYPTSEMKGAGYSYNITPLGKYIIKAGNNTMNISITEDDIMNGKIINIGKI